MSLKKISLLIALLISGHLLYAQEVEENIRMVKPFKADGISNEWNEPLNQYNDATRLAFALANDDQNLYFIIESLDPQTTFRILSGGITLNINTAGKPEGGGRTGGFSGSGRGMGGMGGGRGVMGGGRGQRPREGGEFTTQPADFWIKYKLVKG
ncbi:hypothetical protein [Pedobacter zeae]|nr:hypothetical protein [Pedobacter zeae]MBB4107304.1 hypothetical protein [Pedobacter zeae]